MELLKYREILDKKFEVYSDRARIYKNYIVEGSVVELYFSGTKIKVSYFSDYIVKIFIAGEFEDEENTNAICMKFDNKSKITVTENKDEIIISGTKVVTVVNKNTTEIEFKDTKGNTLSKDFQPSFKKEDGTVFISKLNDCSAYYGLGEKGGNLNKKGCYTENYNTDDPETDDNSVMYYKTIPFYVGVNEKFTHGIFFDNSYRSFFDMGKQCDDRVFFGATGGQIQYYLIYGENVKEVVKQYSNLTGKMELPPLWSLGYQQNRFSYFSTSEVRDVVKEFEERNIPIDVMYLDIDYMDGFRVMTFKSPQFDDARELIAELKQKGIKTITILDPGVKVDDNYGVYQRGLEGDYFTKKSDGDVFVGAVWPNDSAFPDFANKDCREWWKSELKDFIGKYNIDGIWNDMNEPCVFNNDQKAMLETCLHKGDDGVIEHAQFHNRYGMEMSRCSMEAQNELHKNQRGFSMTRATYAGGQRYSSVWTGDNMSLWSQLRMSIPMNCNLGVSGFSFVGNDVGGFGLDTTAELFVRWMQLGTFLPIFRNHSNMYTRRQEPWAFGKNVERIATKAIELRYELLPYIYNEFYKSYKDGIPVFRPMVMEFQNDLNARDLKEQFMFGDDILVAPVVHEGEREKIVYLPNGNWYRYDTGEELEGGKRYKLRCDLDEILFFVKEHSIIPTYRKKFKNVESLPDTFTYKVYGDNAELIHYYDDGKTFEYKDGKYNLVKISFSDKDETVKYLINGVEKRKKEFIVIL
ncbi:MAG: glycoside hydrolase family 31 protein [Sarcina sp.]